MSQPEPENVVEKVPFTWQRAAPAARDNVAEPVRAEELQRTPPAPAKPIARVDEPARRSDKWWVEDGETAVERETTVAGPSFLGLSSAENGESGGYSYLLEDEKQSHAGRWVFLLVLVALGAALYWKWQPIRDFVLTTAITHSRPQPKPAQATSAPAAAAETAAPTTTLTTNDTSSQPSITTEPKPPNDTTAPKEQPAAKEPEAAATPDVSAKPDDSPKPSAADNSSGAASEKASRQPRAKTGAVKEEPPAEDDNADEDRPSAARKARAPQANPGGDLVSSGERYLYGRGVARSCDQAVSYFNAAAAKQNPQAFSHLGALYATGNCVPMDRAAAYAWFRRAYAKEPSNHYFEQNLTMLWREMSPDERLRAAGRQ